MKDLNKNGIKLIKDAMREKIGYIYLNKIVYMLVLRSTPDLDCRVQVLEWILQIKHDTEDSLDVWY